MPQLTRPHRSKVWLLSHGGTAKRLPGFLWNMENRVVKWMIWGTTILGTPNHYIYIYTYIYIHMYIYIYIWINIPINKILGGMWHPSTSYVDVHQGAKGCQSHPLECLGSVKCPKDSPLRMYTMQYNIIWVCLKMGYTPNYSHLVGIMIINHWVIGYTIFRQTHIV